MFSWAQCCHEFWLQKVNILKLDPAITPLQTWKTLKHAATFQLGRFIITFGCDKAGEGLGFVKAKFGSWTGIQFKAWLMI